LKFICPLVTVKDIDLSREFYVNILDQKVKYDFGENVTFEGDFAIHQQDHFQKLIKKKEIVKRSNNFELYFEVADPGLMIEKLKSCNIEFIHDLKEQPWRQKVVRFYDPDDNIIEIGETLEHLCSRLYLEGLKINKISEITNMPKIFVKSSIRRGD